MNPQTLQYLQSDEIGKVIAKGLADLYLNQPEKPVKYLAEWLKNHSSNKKQLKNLMKEKNQRKENMKLYEQANQLAASKAAAEAKTLKEREERIEAFKNQIKNHEYQEELLEEIFPEFIENHIDITGAYVGCLNHPSKPIADQDSDEEAHLNLQIPKLINYIGSSVSHKDLMRGKILELQKGVTGEAFKLAEENGEDESKKKYVYVSNVVKNEKVHYFRIPKLGAYLAVPLVYNSYLKEQIFDTALEEKLKFEEQLTQFTKNKDEALGELKTQLEESEKKLSQLKQKNGQEGQIEIIQNENNELKKNIEEKEAESLVEKDPQLPLEKKSYVVCVDNLGKDRELEEKDIKFLEQLTRHFQTSWQEKQKQLLKKDITTQMYYLSTLSQSALTLKENYEKQLELDEETIKQQVDTIEDEKLKQYKKEQLQYSKLKEYMKSNKNILDSFLKLKQFRVLKFKSLIQNILHFLNYSKSQVNIPNKTVLNWKEVKVNQISNQNFNKILEFIVHGPKDGSFNFYSKTPFLLQKFEKYNEEDVFSYNIGLGMILKFVKQALKLRISNVEMRKEQKEVERKKRDEIIAENDKTTEQKAQQLEKDKAAHPPEEGEFKEEEWSTKYDEEHPLKEVPPEVIDDIDNDI